MCIFSGGADQPFAVRNVLKNQNCAFTLYFIQLHCHLVEYRNEPSGEIVGFFANVLNKVCIYNVSTTPLDPLCIATAWFIWS